MGTEKQAAFGMQQVLEETWEKLGGTYDADTNGEDDEPHPTNFTSQCSTQCSVGTPLISLQQSNVAFSTSNRSMRMLRSIEMLKTIEICSALQYVRKLNSTHRGFRGPSNVLLARR